MGFGWLVALATTTSVSAQNLYGATSYGDLLEIDPATGSVMSSIGISVAGESVFSANGMAYDPGRGRLMVLLRTNIGNYLSSIETQSGVATHIGSVGDQFAGVAVTADGRYFGVTGDGAASPEQLYELDPVTAAPTFLAALGNGNDGESIGVGPEPGILYHLSGYSGGEIFEWIDTDGYTTTDIPFPGLYASYTEGISLAWSNERHAFLMGDIAGRLWEMQRDGTHTPIAYIGASLKGLAIVGQAQFMLSGSCPGTIDIFFSGLTPNGSLGVIGSSGYGNAQVWAGPCAGQPTVLNGGNLQFFTLLNANANGVILTSRTLTNANHCGKWVQGVDVGSCQVTNAAEVPQ